jgi:hypothetical protein
MAADAARWLRLSVAAACVLLGAAGASAQEVADTGVAGAGELPRIESDPHVSRPTMSWKVEAVDQEHDDYWKLVPKWSTPFAHNSSWEVELPLERWDSGGASVSGIAGANVVLNHGWRRHGLAQSLSLQLNANVATSPQLGSHQWEIEGTYGAGAWLGHALSGGLLLSWTYGFAVDSGFTQTNVIQPRVVVSFHLTRRVDATLDWRPRFDLTRGEYYATLMPMIALPLGRTYGLQAGYEFPLDALAEEHVEKSRVYVSFAHHY